MAQADDASSTMIWLRDALALAVDALGSKALAIERLREWLAAGILPWSCMSWKGLDVEGLAAKRQEKLDKERLAKKRRKRGNSMGYVIYSLPSAAYCSGDPRFWSATLRINWENNAAYEVRRHGAQALGIRVPHKQLLMLLPEEFREREEALRQTEPAEQKLMKPKVWLAKVRKEYPQQKNEQPTAYARRLHPLMQKAAVTRIWSFETLVRRLHD